MNMTAIAIVGIICWTIVSLVESRKSKTKAKQTTNQDNSVMQAKLDQMQARIETLEKIVTDEKYDLHRQFDALSRNADRAA